jgi:hypothetical protein
MPASGGDADPDAKEDIEWVKRVHALPGAKHLIEHLSALECVLTIGGQELVEPPVEQCQTWRRIIMSEMQAGKPMLGVKRDDGGMPKCLAMTNLSGHHAAYYSDSASLAKVICMSAQPATPRFADGVNAVCEKARQLGASLLVCFCCPFQYGLDRLHWELRTVRRVNGEIVDGEMGFSSMDTRARPFPRTSATEHWSHELLAELKRKMFSVVSPLCLDTPVPEKASMGEDRMQKMIAMLQEERRRMIEDNRTSEKRMREAHQQEKEDLEQQLLDAEAKADARVAKVTEAAVNSRRAAETKELELNARVSKCMGEAVTQKALVEDMLAKLAGQTLEREQEAKEHKAREATLQAQVKALSASNAKAVAEHTKALKAATQAGSGELAALRRRAKDLEKQLANTRVATGAVNAASEQVRKANSELQSSADRAAAGERAALGVLRLAAARHARMMAAADTRVASAEAAAQKRERAAAESAVFQLNEQLACVRADVETAAEAAEEKMAAAERESAALRAKADGLSASLSDAQDTVASLKAQNAHLSAAAAPSPPAAAPPARSKKGAAPAGAVVPNGAANGVPYAPTGHFRSFGPDPALEACIAQLQASMEFVVASARSSCASARSAELAHAKLEALVVHGIPQPAQFWPGYQM